MGGADGDAAEYEHQGQPRRPHHPKTCGYNPLKTLWFINISINSILPQSNYNWTPQTTLICLGEHLGEEREDKTIFNRTTNSSSYFPMSSNAQTQPICGKDMRVFGQSATSPPRTTLSILYSFFSFCLSIPTNHMHFTGQFGGHGCMHEQTKVQGEDV